MIVHVVLFKPKAELSAGDRGALVEAFERALREIPTVRGVRIARRITHGAGYESVAPNVADFLVVIDVVDRDNRAHEVTATTLVKTHNLFGRVYLDAVLPFHRHIVPALLAQAASA